MLVKNNNFVNKNVSFGRLVPINEYSGPILKLTKEEIARVSALQENIAQLEIELYGLNKHFSQKRLLTPEWSYFAGKVDNITTKIDILKDMIKEIKMKRLNSQKGFQK